MSINIKFLLVFILIISVTLTSCNTVSADKNKNKITYIDINSNTKPVNNLIHSNTSIELIDLETIKDCYLIKIDKVFFTDSLFITYDKQQSKIYTFNNKGKYKYSIGKRGVGPDCYRRITDVAFDKTKKQLIVLSNNDMAIFKYDISGKLLSRHKLNFFSFQLEYLNQDNLIFYCNNNSFDGYNLILTDLNGKEFAKRSPIPKGMPEQGFSFIGGISKGVKDVFYSKIGDPYIYNIHDKTVSPKYKVLLNGQKLAGEDLSYEMYIHKVFSFDVSFFHNNIKGNDSSIILTYQKSNLLQKAIYKIDDGIVYTIEDYSEDFISNILYKMSSPLGYKNGNYFISYISSEQATRIINEIEFEKIPQNLIPQYEKIKNIKEESNPVLVVYNL